MAIPDPRLKRGGFDSESTDRVSRAEPRPDCALGIVLVRSRVAEVNQNAIPHILRDKAVEASDDIGDGAVIGGNDLAQILGVEPRGQPGRADQVAEHHRQLPALRLGPHPSLPRKRGRIREGAAAIGRDGWKRGRQCFGRAERGDGVEQSAAMADRGDTQLAQIVARESA